ncbi:MAG: T9SS type A sorting domain-containing protein [Bacteroidota bacterium]
MKQMKFRLLTLLFLCSLGKYTMGQEFTCDGLRSAPDIVSAIDSVKGLQYGANRNTVGALRELLLDLYLPVDNSQILRPTLILAFGGGFTDGQREDMAELCRRFARKGFVAATIDYRILDAIDFLTITDSTKALEFVLRAAQDVKASIRYMRSLADGENIYRIDPDNIFVGGVSAGAIAANHAVYLDSTDEVSDAIRTGIANTGGWLGNSNDLTHFSSEVSGVISWSGALNNDAWIDPSDPPLITVHEEGDEVVPYTTSQLQVGVNVFVTFKGSFHLESKAQEVGLYSETIVFQDRNTHVSYFLEGDQEEEDSVINQSAAFIKTVACGVNSAVSRFSDLRGLSYTFFPNPSEGSLTLKFDTPGEELQLHVYSLEGKLQKSFSFRTTETMELSLEGLSPGLYSLVPFSSNTSKLLLPQLLEIQ